MPTRTYIKPRIREFNSFQELEENFSKYGNLFPDLNEGINPVAKEDYFKRAFVIADPGYGKTRLLKEIIENVKNQEKIAIYVDLKKFADSKYISLEEYMRNTFPEINSVKFEMIESDKAIFCLDALDEIRDDRFVDAVDELKKFLGTYTNLSVLLSSRLYFFKNNLFKINDLNLNYWLIYSFSHSQVRKYLTSRNISSSSIDSILSLLTNNDRDLIISVPRYLELLPEYLDKHGISDLNKLNRTDLFDFFIFNKLDLEEKRSETRGKEIIKRVLEMLALTMEIYQTNVLSKEDLTTFLDEISSGLNQFWHKIPLKVFFENSLLKDGGETIEFENTEFQEYLAAKHLSRLNKPLQVTFDLVIDHEAEEIKPTWFSTLEFLSEIDQNLVKPLLDFGDRNRDKPVVDERYFQLLTRFNIDQLSDEKKSEIFMLVFEYYQKVLHWLDWSIGKNLSFYYVTSLHNQLLKYSDRDVTSFRNGDERSVQLANVTQIVGYLIRHKKLSEDQLSYWKDKLVSYANETTGPGVLQRHSLFALEAFRDSSLISQLPNLSNHRDSLVRRRFFEFCIEVDPNSEKSIDYFIDAIITNEYEGFQGIENITKLTSLKYLLEAFLNREHFLETYLDRNEGVYSTKSDKLLKNLDNVWNQELEDLTKQVILKSFQNHDTWYRAGDSKLIIGLANQVRVVNENYIHELLDSILRSDVLVKHISNFRKIYAGFLNSHNLASIYRRLNQVADVKWFLFRVLQEIKYSDRADNIDLYEAGRVYFADEYRELEASESVEPQLIRTKSTYDDFKFKLEPEVNQYMQDVFSFFNRHYKDISSLVTQQDKDRLKELLIGSVFSKFDPGKYGIQDSNNHQTHTMHSWISIFGDSIVTSKILNLDVSEYRDRIVNYIPFAFEQAELDAIFHYVNDLNEDDIGRIVGRYRDRSDDTWRYHPSAFIQTVQKFKILSAIPVLKEFVSEKELSIYDRIEATKIISGITKDKEYIRSITEAYSNQEDLQLAEEANGLLITDYLDDIAIEWRVEQLKNRAFTFVRVEGAHSVGGDEIELDMKKFAGPLYVLSSEKYEELILSLLQKSFQLLEENNDYLPYSSYLWELVYTYFENRKVEGSYRPLRSLERYLQNFQGKIGVNWFMGKLKDLKKIYIETIGRPQNYSMCIQIYNQIRSANYIQINTHEDLLHEIIQVVENEIAKFLEGEGKVCLKQDETEVQKQLKTEIENAFLRRYFRPTDIRQNFLIWREPQDMDDKRCDFVITYGFLGPILIELKLSSHGDMAVNVLTLKKNKSFSSLQKYISSFRPKFSIFLVLDNKKRIKGTSWSKHIGNIRQAYECLDNVKVIGLPMT